MMNEDDPTLKDGLQCDVKIDCANGPAVAYALRELADKIERESLDSGHHDVTMPNGNKVGEVYLDYYSES